MRRDLLVVDDDVDMIECVVKAAHDRGFHVVGTTDPTGVVHYVREKRPQLLLLDLRMPKLDGRDILAALTSDPDVTTTVVVMSGMDDPLTIDMCLRYGAADFVRKPFELASLFRRLELVLREKARPT